MPVTQNLNEIFGYTDDAHLWRKLREEYKDSDAENERRKRMKKRKDLYCDRGAQHHLATINKLFKSPRVRELRKMFVEFALYQNITKRIIREISTVYAEPANRKSSTGQRYKDFQTATKMDRRMRMVNRYGNLQNNVLVWPDINDAGDPTLRVVTQDELWAIAHPNDKGLAVAYVVDRIPRAKDAPATMTHYIAMDGETYILLDKEWRIVKRYPHNVGRLPALLFSREEKDDAVLDAWSGEDLISAHEAIALINVMMLKHQKSGTKQAYATGDLSNTAMGQPMEEEHLLQLGEGVSLNTLDLGADPESYIKTARAVIKQIAANYGIPESVFDLSYQATSGFEIELKRAGLRELRRDQIADFRPFEQELAQVQSGVMKAAGHKLSFDTKSWSINFGEIDVPQDPIQKLTFWEKKEQMDLANRIEMYLHENPEMDEKQAEAAIELNRQMRIERMRDFQTQNRGAFGAAESGDTAPMDRNGNRLTVVDGGADE